MTIWVDAQLSPRIALWTSQRFAVDCVALRDLGLRDAEDEDIFFKAREQSAIVLTKDSDFVRLLENHGAPPKILWLTCGNTSEIALQTILTETLPAAMQLLSAGENLVEIGSL